MCRNITAGEMFIYLQDKTEQLSLPATVTGISSWLRLRQPSWVMKAIKTIQLWKFPWGFHLWHPQSFWAPQTQIKQQVLLIQTRWLALIHAETPPRSFQTLFHPLLSGDVCADFSNFIFLPVTILDWLHQLHSVQLLCGTIKAVSRQHRKCGSFYRYPFTLHKQSPNDT